MLPSKIIDPIELELEQFESTLSEIVRSDVSLVDRAMQHVLAHQGKRIRPVILLLCSHLGGGHPQGHIHSAVAVELLHTATLVHDDVVDESDTRRGAPTLNAIWDNKISILVGDYMFAKALEAALRAGKPGVLDVISNVSQRMSQGELRQLRNNGADPFDVSEYYRVIRDKTASLFSASCQLGGIAASSSDAEIQRLGELGEKIGLAFQIMDDVLDYVGSPDKMGKPRAQDLREGKITLPLLKALERSGDEERQLVLSYLNGYASEAMLQEIVEMVKERGGVEAALEEARNLRKEALESLSTFGPSPYRAALSELIDFVVEREN